MENHRVQIDPAADRIQEIRLTDAVVDAYGLEKWAQEFWLMTAGYRDRLDPDDAGNPGVPFNLLTVALMAEAKARVFTRKLAPGQVGQLHIGGEVRPHTQAFIQVMARVYAAHGFQVHLRRELRTTPIWYSSFGIFYEEFESGDNLTASHSPYFKGGWKPLDAEGKQLTEEEPEIIAAARDIVNSRATIPLAPWQSSGHIFHDFDVDEPYVTYQRSVLGTELLATIQRAGGRGFRCHACPVGGSMGATSRRLFARLGIAAGEDGIVQYFLDQEDPHFHRVGEVGGENHGADVCKREIYTNVGARERLLSGQANVVFLWDPDGDRFNVVTIAPDAWAQRAAALGLEVDAGAGGRSIVYLNPNQLYLMLTAYRIELLKSAGLLQAYDWFVGISFPTAKAIEEFATQHGMPVVRVPVGFKNIGALCRAVEANVDRPQTFTMVTGQQVHLGPKPRVLMVCEESGGATFGGSELLRSRTGKGAMLALREKDGMQMALLTLGLASALHESGRSFAQEYCELLDKNDIQYRFSVRVDARLYDESLMGSALQAAKEDGLQQRDRVVAFFRELAEGLSKGDLSPGEVRARLIARNPAAAALPEIRAGGWMGDGSMLEMEGLRLIVRASGTDAVLRYYIDGTSQQQVTDIGHVVGALNI